MSISAIPSLPVVIPQAQSAPTAAPPQAQDLQKPVPQQAAASDSDGDADGSGPVNIKA